MSESRQQFSIVDYYGSHCSERCGYCKPSQTQSAKSHSMWAHCLTVEDYQALIDRGWRRSGHYCYKPNMSSTCCPSYTIRCDVQQFRCTKSQKKVIKKVNRYLVSGAGSTTDGPSASSDKDEERGSDNMEPIPDHVDQNKRNIDMNEVRQTRKEHDKIRKEATAESEAKGLDNPTEMAEINNVDAVVQKETSVVQNQHLKEPSSSSKGEFDGAHPQRKKAKLLRIERNQQKRLQKGLNPEGPSKPGKNAEKSLEALLSEVPDDSQHKLKVKLVQASRSWSDTPELFPLYQKYQVIVHNDRPSRLKTANFERFLVGTPFKLVLVPATPKTCFELVTAEYALYAQYQNIVHDDPDNDTEQFVDFLVKNPFEHEIVPGGPSVGYGTFHQQYWLDGKLIAVGVLDILPRCVTAVYFFYDPDYRFMSLGTYSSFREIELAQRLMRECPSIANYYMGFYIHSCPKMRYKAHMKPSYLLCPEVYSWHLLEDSITKKLDKEKYQRLNGDLDAVDPDWFNPRRDLDRLLVLKDMRVYMTYEDYKTIVSPNVVKKQKPAVEYGELVGKSLGQRMLLLR